MKEEEVYDMNYIHGLNWMSYWYQQMEVEKNKK